MNKAKIISIANEKGGVGKTTTTVNTASCLVKLGYKVLVVDFDHQTHLTVSLGFTEPEILEFTLTDFIRDYVQHKDLNEENIKKSIVHSNGIDLMPSTFLLSDYEFALKSITDGEYALADILKPLIPEYDYILIDCKSSVGIYTINALVVSNSVLIPTQAHYLATNGLQLILYCIQTVKKRLNPYLKISGILITMAQNNTSLCKNTIKTLKEDYADMFNIFDITIPWSITVADAPSKGIPLIDYAKNNKGAIAYSEFVEELVINE